MIRIAQCSGSFATPFYFYFLNGLLAVVLCCGISAAQGTTTRRAVPDQSSLVPLEASQATTESGQRTRPNILMINLDDADLDIFSDKILEQYLPNIKRLATDGWRFTNCHATTPLCGPSRACLLRGQHAHKTGTKTNQKKAWFNNGYTGEYSLFQERGYEEEHLGVWMHRAGYRTMLVGKYLHGGFNPDGIPGWDDLYISFGGQYYGTSRYNGRLKKNLRRDSNKDHVYRTVAEADEAVMMIQAHAKRNAQRIAQAKKDTGSGGEALVSQADFEQPFFLYIAPFAPHLPAQGHKMVQNKYDEIAPELEIVKTPDFNEGDTSDKPLHLQHLPLTTRQVEGYEEEFRNRVRSMKSVDDMVERLLATLADNSMRENTYIFFTSDHGYQLGHNRMAAKKVPYHRNTRIPLFVTGPKVNVGSSGHLLAHIDLTATFLDMAGAMDGGRVPVELDGKSLVSLLEAPDSIAENQFRESLLIQNWEDKNHQGHRIHARYASLRMNKQIYTQWSNGQREFYDLAADPYQLENRIDSLTPEQQTNFSKQLHALKTGVEIPIVTVGNAELVGSSPTLEGVAEDDNSVEKVELEITDPANNLYWNGSGWQSKKSVVVAGLKNQGGLISDWEYPIDFSTIKDKGNVVLVARSFDDLKNVSREVEFKFSVDAVAPRTELKAHLNGSTIQSPATLSGTCSDDFGLSGVEVKLQRLDDGFFWNGSTWSKRELTVLKRAKRDSWHIKVPVAAGKYQVVVRAVDLAGNYDPSPATAEFSVR